MATKNVFLNWDAEEAFVFQDKDGFQFPMKPKGVSASDLLPLALIGCSSHDVVEILRKQKQNLTALRVSAESEQDDDPPWTFRKIHMRYQAVGKGLDAEKVGKAILLSEEKYCSVYNTLKDAVEITHEFEVTEK